LSRTKSSLAFKARHHHASAPVTPYRSTSLLQHDVTHIAGKAYTLPRRQQQQQQLSSSPGYSPPLAGATRLRDAGGLTVWLGADDDVDDRLSASARCTCTLRRAVAASRPPADATPTTTVFRGLSSGDTPTSFVTFKPAASTTLSAAVDVGRAPALARPDCGTFYDRPPLQRDDTATDYGHSRAPRDKPAK